MKITSSSVHPDYAYLKQFIEQIPVFFNKTGHILHDGRNNVKLFEVNNEPLIVKKYKLPNIFQRVVYTFFKKSKAERAYLYAGVFRERGFNTPHEIAYIQINHFGLLKDCYFLSTFTSDLPLLPVLKQRPIKTQLVNELAAFLVNLHLKGIMHGDLNLTNILFRQEKECYKFSLIDINRSRFLKSPSTKDCIDDLKRVTHDKVLLQSIVYQYATIRNWSKEECVKQVMKRLSRLEKQKQRKYQILKILRIKR